LSFLLFSTKEERNSELSIFISAEITTTTLTLLTKGAGLSHYLKLQ